MPSFRILSFDGGGIKGALSTRLLKRLFEDNPDLIKKTNLFAGTSTGALISLLLAYGINPKEIDDLYNYKNIKKIFTPKRINLFHPKYKNINLKHFINSVIPENTELKDLSKYVFIPAFSLKGINEKNWQGIFFNNLSKNFTIEERIIDVALAASAAPTYFPSHNGFIDGGIVTNSPAFAAVLQTIKSFNNKHTITDFKVISIGTGNAIRRVTCNTENWGILQWALRPFASVKLPIISVLLNDSIPLENSYCKELLKENYIRINPTIPDNIEIDDYKKVPYLKNVADNTNLKGINDFINNVYLK